MRKNQFIQPKTISLYILIMVNLLLMPYYSSTKAMTNELGIMTAFAATEAELKEINVNAHVNMKEVFTTPEKASKVSLDLASKLGLQQSTIKDTSTEGNTQVYLGGQGKTGDTIAIIVQSTKDVSIRETNIVIDMVQEGEFVEIDGLGNTIKDVLKPYGTAKLTSCITATYPGKLRKTDKEKIAKNVFHSLDAKEIEGLREENIISIVGFSPKIQDWISYGGNKANLNVALRYNSYEDRTYLWIATPLIAIGY
ncbi:YwmB family TATA-box binding protein [Clostridiaceae bacterium 35-E11]